MRRPPKPSMVPKIRLIYIQVKYLDNGEVRKHPSISNVEKRPYSVLETKYKKVK